MDISQYIHYIHMHKDSALPDLLSKHAQHWLRYAHGPQARDLLIATLKVGSSCIPGSFILKLLLHESMMEIIDWLQT